MKDQTFSVWRDNFDRWHAAIEPNNVIDALENISALRAFARTVIRTRAGDSFGNGYRLELDVASIATAGGLITRIEFVEKA